MCVFVLPFLGWLWKVGDSGLIILLMIGAIMAVLSFAWPHAVKPIFIGLMLAAAPIGIVVSEVAMLLIFLGVFLPIGLIFRLIGRDALRRKYDMSASTYWESKREPETVSSYYRLY